MLETPLLQCTIPRATLLSDSIEVWSTNWLPWYMNSMTSGMKLSQPHFWPWELPSIEPLVSPRSILEHGQRSPIASGHGRWTSLLINQSALTNIPKNFGINLLKLSLLSLKDKIHMYCAKRNCTEKGITRSTSMILFGFTPTTLIGVLTGNSNLSGLDHTRL